MGKSLARSQVVGGLNRGAWTSAEDKTLIDYVKSHREGRWNNIAKVTGLRRCGKSCRLRWMNYLRPDIKRGNITFDEEDLILRLHKLLGNRWALIAGRLPGRTDNEIKNYWNTHLAKKAQDQAQSNLFTVLPSSRAAADTDPPPPIAAADLRSAPPQLLAPDPIMMSPRQDNNNYDRSFLAPTGPTLTSPDGTVNNNNAVESDSSDPSSCGGDVDESQPFIIDFSIDDIYQILDPDFARFDGAVLSGLNAGVDPGEESHRRHDHAGSDSDIRSLASFLESEAWLGDGDDHVTGGACRECGRVGA